ncbi:MAG: polysaccharide deacetylase family protein [Gemmatimonadales bacterium]
MAGGAGVSILMYHAIAEAPGPTSIPPVVFRAQMEALAASGRPVVPLEALLAGFGAVPPGAVVITFDDGFVDFATEAWPVLRDLALPATVFLPTDKMGGREDWAGGHLVAPRPLMSWDQVRATAAEGVAFGGHSMSHPDLTTLDAAALEAELVGCRDRIAAELGRVPETFAPPYGATNPTVRAACARHFRLSVGTRLGRAVGASDPHDLPRLEMHYFRDLGRWQAYLAGRAEGYLLVRQLMRSVRRTIAGG